MVENHTITKNGDTNLSQAFQLGALHVGVNCASVSAVPQQQKAVARNLAVFGAILYFFPGQPACLYSMVYRFMVGMKLRIAVSTRFQTALTLPSPV